MIDEDIKMIDDILSGKKKVTDRDREFLEGIKARKRVLTDAQEKWFKDCFQKYLAIDTKPVRVRHAGGYKNYKG
jgi:hypothetical protein